MSNPIPLTQPNDIWIIGPKRDLVFFILTPLAILPLVGFAKEHVPVETLALYVLGLGGFGHHLPGFIRAYSDPALFRRFKLRFILVPLLLLSLGALFSFLDLNALICATVAWGTWHGAMQINGFLRIYDSKVKSFRPLTARLDWLMCLAWFGLAILHSPTKQLSLVAQFYASGGLLIPPHAFELFRRFWDLSTVLITVSFLANAVRQWKAGNPPSPVKLLTLVSSFAFWWYCVVTLNNLLLGVLMWEIFHDVQYDVLVWLFQRHRVDKHLNASPIEKALFAPGAPRLILYSILILGYGYIGVVTSFGDINVPEKFMQPNGVSHWLLRITIISALLHFYYDGFIWRIREGAIRQGLGVEEGKSPSRAVSRMSHFRHGWKWAFFVIPVAYLGISQSLGRGASLESQMMNLTQAIPGSWMPHFLAGTYYSERAQPDSAEAQYEMAVRYKPDFAIGYLFLGDLSAKKGEFQKALERYSKSVSLDSNLLESRSNLAFLYLKMNKPLEAVEQFQAALRMQPDNPDLHFGMASAMIQLSRLPDAERYLRQTLELAPNHAQALDFMGKIQAVKGDARTAIAYYRKALQADSTNADARKNLAEALAQLPASDPPK